MDTASHTPTHTFFFFFFGFVVYLFYFTLFSTFKIHVKSNLWLLLCVSTCAMSQLTAWAPCVHPHMRCPYGCWPSHWWGLNTAGLWVSCKGGSVLKLCLECWHYSPVEQLHFSILYGWLRIVSHAPQMFLILLHNQKMVLLMIISWQCLETDTAGNQSRAQNTNT